MSKMHQLIAETFLEEIEPYKGYGMIVAAFGQLTNIQHPVSGVCCIKKDEHGAPHCCYTLTDGTYRLSFTGKEIFDLGEGGVVFEDEGILPAWEPWDGGKIWYANVNDQDIMRESLHNGFLSQTLECASHPTRPVVVDGKVTKVVVVKDCIAEYALDTLKENADDFLWLWQQAVNLWGVKPYYITGEMEPGKFIEL